MRSSLGYAPLFQNGTACYRHGGAEGEIVDVKRLSERASERPTNRPTERLEAETVGVGVRDSLARPVASKATGGMQLMSTMTIRFALDARTRCDYAWIDSISSLPACLPACLPARPPAERLVTGPPCS